MKQKRHMFSRIILRCLIWLLLPALALTALVQLALNAVDRGEIQLAVAQSGALPEETMVSGIFLFAETIVKADYTGEFNGLAESGSRVAAGGQVGTLTLAVTDLVTDGRVETLAAPSAGLVSYTFDGFEDIFTSGADLDWSAVEQRLARYESQSHPSGTVYRGEALYKLIDDRAPLRYFTALDADALPELPSVGDTLTLAFDDFTTAATVDTALLSAGRLYLVVTLSETRVSLYAARLCDAVIVSGETRGVTVDCAALTDDGSRSGVWISQNGSVTFRPVTVVRAGEEFVVVEGVKEGELYVQDASTCRDGDRLAGLF